MRNIVIFAVTATALIAPAGCRKPVQAVPAPSVFVVPAAIPEDPQDKTWSEAPVHVATLLTQDMVEPRSMSLSTEKIRVSALTDGREVAFRLQWSDGANDDRSVPARFADACAVQLPAKTEPTLPAPQMGEPGRPVEIVYWSAAWQATVDGRGDSIRDLYPNASVDHYPFEAKPLEPGSAEQREMAARYSPARSLGNTMAGPRKTPVQDLVAEGPGTLSPRPSGGSTGRGRRTSDGWAVVIRRKLPEGLSPRNETQVAFAVWEGGHQEVGARKMRTAWIPLVMQEKP
jgi:hypothetical protein